MALLELPVWSVPPDWADVVTEGLEWLTTVLASITGAEQRMPLRLSPRRYLEYTIRAIGEWRTYLDALLSTTDQAHFYLPIWYEQGKLSANANSGATSFTVVGVRTELNASSVVFLRGDRPWQYELSEVTSVSISAGHTTFNLSAALVNSWPKGTRVYPTVVAQLNDQPKFNKLSPSIAETSVRFDFIQTNDWTGTPSLPTYRGFSVVEFPTNEGDTQTGSYFRVNTTLDNTTGLTIRRDLGGIGFPGFTATNFTTLRANLDKLRSLLYFLKGRTAAVWLVNPADDFILHKGMLSADTTITVNRSGFTEITGPVTGREDIRILLGDGSVLYRRILSSVINGDGVTEVLTLDAAIGLNIRRETVQQISFMTVGRLDQDLVELTHTTDADGVCNVALVTKAVPDLRVATDWDPPALQLTDFGNCGPTIPGRLWVRVNNGFWNGSPGANPAFGFAGVDISGLAGPYFPFFQINAIYDVPIPCKLTANFSGTIPFRFPIPHRAFPWDNTDGTFMNPADGAPDLNYLDGDLSIHKEIPSSAAGFGQRGYGVRANTSTATQDGLRYFEVYTSASAAPNGPNAGVANSSAVLTHGGVDGGHGNDADTVMFGDGGSTLATILSGMPDYHPGDTICIAIFT